MFVRTPRLLLRPGWREDAPALASLVNREGIDAQSAAWPHALCDPAAYLMRERRDGEADFLVFLRTPAAPRLIGGIGIASGPDGHELGYWIVPSHSGRGFATEAGRAVIATARDTLRIARLVARPAAGAVASTRVLAKLGFVPFTGTRLQRGDASAYQRWTLDLRRLALAA